MLPSNWFSLGYKSCVSPGTWYFHVNYKFYKFVQMVMPSACGLKVQSIGIYVYMFLQKVTSLTGLACMIQHFLFFINKMTLIFCKMQYAGGLHSI